MTIVALGIVCNGRMLGSSNAAAQTIQVALDTGTVTPSTSQEKLAGVTAIERVTYYRRFLKLPAVTEDTAMSARALEQARAQLQTLSASASRGSGLVSEANGGPGVRVTSKSGYGAGGGGNPTTILAIAGVSGSLSGGEIIDRMMAMPFTALRIIDPQLVKIGFGLQCDAGSCVAIMSPRRGLDKPTRLELYEPSDADRFWNPNLGPIPPTPGRLMAAVEFPPDGGLMPKLAYSGGDWPSPLAACPEYSTPSGPPIILQLGKGASGDNPEISSPALTRDGQRVDACLIQASSFGRGDNDEAKKNPAREDLSAFGAVIMIPREPLAPASRYAVSMTADSTNYSWSFRTQP